MARMPRVVVPHYPHHVTQRGNRRQTTCFLDEDYQAYLDLLAKNKTEAGVDVWAYCLMPNHVHLVLVPDQPDSLGRLFRVAHREYTRRINLREDWRGHLWQESSLFCNGRGSSNCRCSVCRNESCPSVPVLRPGTVAVVQRSCSLEGPGRYTSVGKANGSAH